MSCIRTPASAWSARHSGWRLAASLAFLLLAAPGLPGGAWAADAASAKTSALADTTKPVIFLKQTVVTGARYPRAYYDSPQALSFLSRTDLKEQRPTVLGDALYGVPGTDNSKDSPWEQRPVLRGLGGQRVLVMMDGDAMNSARGNGPHPSLVDASQVERVEVVRGPSSVAYGSDALAGVINIITRQAPTATTGKSMRGAASIGGSSADQQFNGDLQLMPQIGKLSAFISTGGRNAEDFQTPDNGKVAGSSFSDYNAIANVRYGLTDQTALKVGWQLYRGNKIGIPGLAYSQPGYSQEFQFPYYNRNAASLLVDHTYAASSWFASSSVKGYWQSEDRNFFSDINVDLTGSPGFPPGPVLYQQKKDRYFALDTYGLHAQADSRKFDRYRLSWGLDASRDKTAGTNVSHETYSDGSGGDVFPPTVTVTQSLPTGNFDNVAGFGQSDMYLSKQWTLSAGARYTYYHYRTDFGVAQPANPGGGGPPTPEVDFQPYSVDKGAVAGSVGLVYALKPDLHISANVANGYRQPNAQDLFFNGPASVGIVLGNPALKPEKSISYDLGLRWGPGNLALSGNLFYSTFDDLIDAIQTVADPDGPGPAQAVYQYVNITKARMYGGEAEAEWRFRPQWDLRANCTGTVGDITSSEAILELYGAPNTDTAPLDGVPPFKGNASLRWTSANGRLWVEPATRYSWRTNRLPLPTPGVPQLSTFKKEWIVGDIAAGMKFGHGENVTIGIRNFTNRAYTLPLASLEEPGISVYGSLSTDF
jgi:hemoglobin/transferrin/lactoferrin receptor protein